MFNTFYFIKSMKPKQGLTEKEIMAIAADPKLKKYVPPEGEHYIIVSGNPNSGKSTVVGMLLKMKYKAEKTKTGMYAINFMADNAPKVSDGSSLTATVEIQRYQNGDTILYDVPALKNHGLRKEFENCVESSNLYLSNRFVKQVLVFDVNELTDARGHDFLEFMRKFVSKYNVEALQTALDSTLVIINKVRFDDYDGPEQIFEYIGQMVQGQQRTPLGFSILYLLSRENVYLLGHVREIDFDQRCGILGQKLKNLSFFQLENQYPNIAPESVQLTLKQSLIYKENSLKQLCEKIASKIKQNYSGKTNVQANIKKLEEAKKICEGNEVFVSESCQKRLMELLGVADLHKQLFSLIDDLLQTNRYIYEGQINFDHVLIIIDAIDKCMHAYLLVLKKNAEAKRLQEQIRQERLQRQREKQRERQREKQRERQRQKERQREQQWKKEQQRQKISLNRQSCRSRQQEQQRQFSYRQAQGISTPSYYNGQNPQTFKTKKQKGKGFFGMIEDLFNGIGQGIDALLGCSHKGNAKQSKNNMAFSCPNGKNRRPGIQVTQRPNQFYSGSMQKETEEINYWNQTQIPPRRDEYEREQQQWNRRQQWHQQQSKLSQNKPLQDNKFNQEQAYRPQQSSQPWQSPNSSPQFLNQQQKFSSPSSFKQDKKNDYGSPSSFQYPKPQAQTSLARQGPYPKQIKMIKIDDLEFQDTDDIQKLEQQVQELERILDKEREMRR